MVKSLSKELRVAAEIYRYNEVLKKPIWFTKLCEVLKGEMTKGDVAHSINGLFDWLIVKGEYGETKPDWAGRVYFITSESKNNMKGIYEFMVKEMEEECKCP